MKIVKHRITGSTYEVTEIINQSYTLVGSNGTRRIKEPLYSRYFREVDTELTTCNIADDLLAESPIVVHIDFKIKTERQARPKKETTTKPKGKKQTTGSKVTLKDICEELGIDPSAARRKLRKLMENQGSWSWDSDSEVQKVKNLLQKA